jgi:hypothetical protein
MSISPYARLDLAILQRRNLELAAEQLHIGGVDPRQWQDYFGEALCAPTACAGGSTTGPSATSANGLRSSAGNMSYMGTQELTI